MSVATAFPIYGQAYRVPVTFRDTSGNLLSGWTSATATAYVDGAAGVSATIAETPTGSGVGFIDITAAQMTSNITIVKATITNTSSTAYVAAIYPVQLYDKAGAWDTQTTIRLEDLLLDIGAASLNTTTLASSTYTVAKRDGTLKLQGTYSEGDAQASKGKLS